MTLRIRRRWTHLCLFESNSLAHVHRMPFPALLRILADAGYQVALYLDPQAHAIEKLHNLAWLPLACFLGKRREKCRDRSEVQYP